MRRHVLRHLGMLLALLGTLGAFALTPTVEAAAPKRATQAAQSAQPEPSTPEAILAWMDRYRLEPAPAKVPAMVRTMSRLGLLKEREKAGMFVGFLAGVLGDSPAQARGLVDKMFPLPPEDQGVLILAIVYCGLGDWRAILEGVTERMPARKVLIRKHLYEKHVPLGEVALDSGPEVLDILWGNYLATGRPEPIVRMMAALPWSSERGSLDKLTAGGVAKWTLAANGAREKELLDLYRRELPHQPKAIQKPLQEVITAAETFETGKIRKEMVDAIEETKRRNPGPSNPWARLAQYGSVAIAIGCVAASALGQAELGIPCIITGAVSSGAAKLLEGK